MKICLAGSGGGHVRQLLDLQPAWDGHDIYFVTEPTALGNSIAAKHRCRFVAHVAWGQAKLGGPVRMLTSGIANAWQSLAAMIGERPDAIVTTGAGSMAFTVLFGRLFGAKVMLIDSFARFNGPSLFARMIGWLAHERVAQSKNSADRWPGSLLFDPFRLIEGPRPAKEPLVFATVGATLGFPRLVDYVTHAFSDGLLTGSVIVQTGEQVACPTGIDSRQTIDFEEVQAILRRANLVICHAGTGSLITALREGCHVIAIPRMHDLGEHYDDHQLEIAEMFEGRGLIQVARDEVEFRRALAALPDRSPAMATTDPQALIDHLSIWLGQRQPVRVPAQ